MTRLRVIEDLYRHEYIQFFTWNRTRGALWWRKMKFPGIDLKSARAPASSVDSAGWSSSTGISTPYKLFPPQRDSSEFVVCNWDHEFLSPWWCQNFFPHWFSEDKFLMRPTFPNLPNPQSECLLSKLSPRSMHTQERLRVKLFCQTGRALTGPSQKSGDIQWLLQNELLVHWMVLQIVFQKEISHQPGGLGHFADSNSIPWNPPTIFHPILTVAILLKFFLSLFVRLFQRHMSRIHEVLKFDDSMTDFTMLAKLQWIVCIDNFCRVVTARETFANSFPSPVKSFFFARIRLNPLSGKILYHDSVPVIVSRFTSFVEDLVIYRYQVTKLFCSRWSFGLLQGAIVKLVRKQTFQFRSFGKWENSVLPWFWCHFHRTVRIWVLRNVGGCMQFCVLQIICGLLRPHKKISQMVVRISIAISLFILFFVFCGVWWIAPVSWCRIVTSLWCWTWGCTWRVLRWRCRGPNGYQNLTTI